MTPIIDNTTMFLSGRFLLKIEIAKVSCILDPSSLVGMTMQSVNLKCTHFRWSLSPPTYPVMALLHLSLLFDPNIWELIPKRWKHQRLNWSL